MSLTRWLPRNKSEVPNHASSLIRFCWKDYRDWKQGNGFWWFSIFTNLQDTFAHCIGCHNCGTVCPICYCRQCYFDSSVSKPNSDIKLIRAKNKGALAFPLDRLMFHIGRMSHMSLSCVSCGQCSDACPVSIPVAGVFSYVADQTQRTFEYSAGRNDGDPLPLRQFRKTELPGVHELVKDADAEVSSHE